MPRARDLSVRKPDRRTRQSTERNSRIGARCALTLCERPVSGSKAHGDVTLPAATDKPQGFPPSGGITSIRLVEPPTPRTPLTLVVPYGEVGDGSADGESQTSNAADQVRADRRVMRALRRGHGSHFIEWRLARDFFWTGEGQARQPMIVFRQGLVPSDISPRRGARDGDPHRRKRLMTARRRFGHGTTTALCDLE